VVVEPPGVVTVSETGDGTWRVAVEPPEVTTETVVSETGTVVVVVPPYEVKTCETTGEVSIERVTAVSQVDSVHEDGADGMRVPIETDETVEPDSVTDGTDDDGAAV